MVDPLDPGTHYDLVASHTPPTVDGYANGETKWLVCEMCGASLLLTAEPSPGIDEMDHDELPSGEPCPQAGATSAFARELHADD